MCRLASLYFSKHYLATVGNLASMLCAKEYGLARSRSLQAVQPARRVATLVYLLQIQISGCSDTRPAVTGTQGT